MRSCKTNFFFYFILHVEYSKRLQLDFNKKFRLFRLFLIFFCVLKTSRIRAHMCSVLWPTLLLTTNLKNQVLQRTYRVEVKSLNLGNFRENTEITLESIRVSGDTLYR